MRDSLVQNIQGSAELKAYPEPIPTMLLELFSAVLDSIPGKFIYSILLLGSTPRGELSYIKTSDDVDIFSDFEFVIIERTKIPSQNLDKMKQAIKALEISWSIKSPVFHVDFGISSVEKFKITPRTFWSFEVQKTAVVIYGEDARKLLPKVSLENIDRGALNELIFVRLWNMLLQISPSILKRKETSYDQFVIQQAYARNILDIISILLPNRGILCAGYATRLKKFKESKLKEIWKEDTFKFEAATNYKLHPENMSYGQIDFQQPFIDGYKQLLTELTGGNVDSLQTKNEIFRESLIRRLRRHYLEVRLFVRYYKFDVGKFSLMFGDKIKIRITQILFDLHLATDLRLSFDERLTHLNSAEIRFSKISKNFEFHDLVEKNFDERWKALRSHMIDFMMLWFYGRSNVGKQELLDRINWREKQ